jgi:ABC-type amino acid transport substrate-binding protein
MKPARALLALLLAAAGAQACPPGLTLGFHEGEFPPMLMGRGSTFAAEPGWLVLAARQALDRLGCQARFVRRPSRRLETELQQDQLGIGLLIGHTEERASRLAFPLDARGQPDPALAVVASRLALYTLPGKAERLGWDGRQVAAGRRIGVVGGTTQDRVAQELGLPTLPYATFESGLAMLRAGRFDALLVNPEVLPADEATALQELQPPVRAALYYAAASPRLGREHGAFLARFWAGLCQAMREQQRHTLPAGCGR